MTRSIIFVFRSLSIFPRLRRNFLNTTVNSIFYIWFRYDCFCKHSYFLLSEHISYIWPTWTSAIFSFTFQRNYHSPYSENLVYGVKREPRWDGEYDSIMNNWIPTKNSQFHLNFYSYLSEWLFISFRRTQVNKNRHKTVSEMNSVMKINLLLIFIVLLSFHVNMRPRMVS